MISRTHDLAAFTALSAAIVFVPIGPITLGTALLALLANQLGGIAPDLDQPTSPVWRDLPATRLFGKIFSRVTGGHRFISHSIVGAVLFGIAAHFILLFFQPIMQSVQLDIVWWAFMVGLASHLFMDMFTKEGVPLLLPIPINFGIPPIRRLRITTGKKMEFLVVFPLLVIINIWLYAANYPQVVAFLHTIGR